MIVKCKFQFVKLFIDDDDDDESTGYAQRGHENFFFYLTHTHTRTHLTKKKFKFVITQFFYAEILTRLADMYANKNGKLFLLIDN